MKNEISDEMEYLQEGPQSLLVLRNPIGKETSKACVGYYDSHCECMSCSVGNDCLRERRALNEGLVERVRL